MSPKIYIKTIVVILLSISFQFSFAQSGNKRPSIGLTLSGGGAKGLAHIGILQAIDSAGLKIDYITGTSMGSIIGALYATGYSGDSIEAITRGIDWKLLFSTAPGLENINVAEKSEFDKYLVEIPFVEGKFKIGKGVIEGQELWLKLSEVFHPVYNITDFSKLSIPFKCIGTDLTTGNPVEMDHGNIVTAVRASMAIPSVFTPVRYKDKTLVDGGVVNNFPVLNVKKMGADYVIGVNVSQGLFHADSLKTALDILFQIAFYKDAENFGKHKTACDLYITPDLQDYSTGDFASSDSIIDLGKETGRLYYPYFKKLADSLNSIYPKSEFVKDRLPKTKSIKISRYAVNGLNNTTEKFFFGLLDLPTNIEYSHEKISRAVRRVFGSRYYRIIKYDFIPTAAGETEMHFNVTENELSNVKLALNYTEFTKVGIKLNLTTRDLFIKESRALASFEFSENPRVYAEYYQYITKGRRTRFNLNFYGESTSYPVYDDFKIYETLRSNYFSFEGAIQYNLNESSMLSVGQQRIYSQIETKESPRIIFNGDNNFWHTNIYYLLNNVNEKYFTTRGWYLKAEAGYVYGQDPDFEITFQDFQISSDTLNLNYESHARLNVIANHFSPLSKKFTLSQSFSLGYLVTDNPYIANVFLAGGLNEVIRNQIPFVGLDESEIKTGSISTIQLGLQYNIYSKTFLTGRINAGLYDFHKTDKITTEDNLLTGYGLTFGYNSPIGPIELTGMYCDQDGKVRSNIRVGFLF